MAHHLPLSLWLIFLMLLACLDSPAPGTLKREVIEKEDISLTEIAWYILTQQKLLSMALELMLRLLILLSCLQIYFLPITFKYMLQYITKGYAENFLCLRNWLKKLTRLSQSVTAALCPSISKVRSRYSQCHQI